MAKPYKDAPIMDVPCGRCKGCRLDRARDWAIRCIHEAQMHERNSFVTLTYAPEHLPPHKELVHRHFQNFMKDLRRDQGPTRFYMAGEYGTRYGRPHYHACLFGWRPSDCTFWRNSRRGHRLYRSATLERLWRKGHSEIGSVTMQSAGYVARYILEKRDADHEDYHKKYVTGFDPETGELLERPQEYNRMSRRPGIGKHWFDKYWRDVYPNDFIVHDGKKYPPPRYYDKLLDEIEPEMLASIKNARITRANERWEESTQERLRVREQCFEARTRYLGRPTEETT